MTWRRVASVLSVLLVLGSMTACTDEPQQDAPPALLPGRPGEPARTLKPGESNPVPPAPPNEHDVRFVQDMIIHHAQALEMTALAPERAAADTLKRLAERITASQHAEIDSMNSWLRTHGKPTVDPKHVGHGDHAGMPGMATSAQLDALRAVTGAEFDSMFLRLMITHHEGALTMARQAQTSGVEVLAQELADEVIATQSDEIDRMRAMLGG